MPHFSSELPSKLRSIEEALQLAIAHHQAGQLQDAERVYQAILEAYPNHSDAHHNFGVLCVQAQRHNFGLAHFRAALKINPAQPQYWLSYIDALMQVGCFEEARQGFHQARKFVEHAALLDRRAVALQANLQAYIANNSGVLHYEQGHLAEAEERFREALRAKPDLAEAYNNLGNVLKDQGRLSEAETCLRCAIAIKPDYAEAYNNLANPLKDQGKLIEAESNLRRALQIKPDYAEAHNNLANTLREQGRLTEAEVAYRTALSIRPDYVEAYSNLGNVLKDQGRLAEAESCLRLALKMKPDFFEAYDNLLFVLNFNTNQSQVVRFEEAVLYGRRVTERVKERFSNWLCSKKPERLRIGLVSGDLWKHPVGYFLEGLIRNVDQEDIEFVVYQTHHKEDELTSRIRYNVSAWRSLQGIDDVSAAKLIHADGVHILLDLSGHTAHNRLPVFAWKPAPVQVSWLGYFATTGMVEIDYLLADEVGVPASQQKFFTEKIWYLPDTRLCFTPPTIEFPVEPLPALSKGYVTFGCYQSVAKVSDEVLDTWSRIFSALPSGRLRWQSRQFSDSNIVEQTTLRLGRHGIPKNRIALHSAVSREAYLASHAEVDMILDTFPYPGGTTTCESLWMGVPTLTLAGDLLLSRQGASLLTAAGLKDWVVANKTDYISKAIARAEDIPSLVAVRAGLRERVLKSPVFDAHRFARNFEAIMWAMFEQWMKVHRTSDGVGN